MNSLEQKAKQIRKKTLDLVVKEGDSHLASSLSAIDLLTAVYYGVLTKKDKFILSKGHACFGFYAILREKGHSPLLSGHPDIDEKNGVYCTTGSLGHGLPIGVGMAFARKLKKEKGKIYVLMSDGECQEGTTWESSDIASYYKLDNLTAIIDYNKLQALDKIKNVSHLNLNRKFKEFGWHVLEVDGHNFDDIIPALGEKVFEKPNMIIAHTIKGKGISFMEGIPKWQTRQLNEEELKQAYEELK
jgi:transketolase